MNCFISIVIPVYKIEAYLPQCVDSLLEQDFGSFEIILINDGSPDNAGRICDEYARKDSRIRVFHQENAGVSSARNRGIEQARGQWLWFVDGDDYVHKNALSTLEEAARAEGENCTCIAFGASHDVLPKNHDFLFHNTTHLNARDALIRLCQGQFSGVLWDKILKTDAVKANGIAFNPRLGFGEDRLFLFCFLAFAGNGVTYLPQNLYHYSNMRPGAMNSLAKGYNPKYLGRIAAFEEMLSIAENMQLRNILSALRYNYLMAIIVHVRNMKRFCVDDKAQLEKLRTSAKQQYRFADFRWKRKGVYIRSFLFIRFGIIL